MDGRLIGPASIAVAHGKSRIAGTWRFILTTFPRGNRASR
jgi:hypothetical protein